MKRYLINGALTLISGLLISSCHEKVDTEYVSNPVSAKTEEFNAAFKEAFTSNIDPNQDWGFGTTKKRSASTRIANPTAADGNTAWAVPDAVSDAEREKVVAHFSNKSNYTANVLPGLINFWVLHVSRGNHSYTSEPDNNGAKATVIANNQMDYLYVMEGDNVVHIERFNASQGGPMFMQNSESRVFGYHNSYSSEEVSNRFLVQVIDGAYYVGFDFAGTTENKVVKPDGIYDDWIIKLVPGELDTEGSTVEEHDYSEDKEDNTADADTAQEPDPNPNGQDDLMDETFTIHQEITRTEYFQKRRLLQYGRVFCEDLGANYASNRKDFDYNDVVFDAYLNRDEWWKKVSKIKVYEVRIYKIEKLKKLKLDDNKNQVYETDEEGNYVYDENNELIPEWVEYDALVYDHSEPRKVAEPQPTWERVSSSDEITSNNLDADGRGRRYYADIVLMACGATKPIKVGGSNATEVHSAFGGYSVDCIINTFDTHSEREGGFGYHEIADPKRLDEMEIPIEYITVDNPTIKDIPIMITGLSGGPIEARVLEAQQGGVPQKFMSSNQDKWTSERCFLGDAYPNFNNWVSNKDAIFSDNANDNYLYCASYPSNVDTELPFNVATGAASTICKDIVKKVDTSVSNPDLVLKEVDEDGDFNTLEAAGYVVVEDATNVIYADTPTTPSTGGSGSASWSSTSYNGNNGGQELISSTTLTNAGFDPAKGVTLTIKGDCWNWGGPGWSVNVKDGNNNSIFQASNSNSNGASVTYNDYKATVVISLSSTDFGRVLSSAGLHIECNFTNASSMNISITQ